MGGYASDWQHAALEVDVLYGAGTFPTVMQSWAHASHAQATGKP